METIEIIKNKIDQTEYSRGNFSEDVITTAKVSKVVIISWYSDDNVLFSWYIDDEVWAWGWMNISFDSSGRILMWKNEFENDIENFETTSDTKEILEELYFSYLEKCVNIKGTFDEKWYSWYIDLWEGKENFKHTFFELLEDWEKHTRGVIIQL